MTVSPCPAPCLLLTEFRATIAWIRERATVSDQIGTAHILDVKPLCRLEAIRMRGRADLLEMILDQNQN
jgi:hypothetical protein